MCLSLEERDSQGRLERPLSWGRGRSNNWLPVTGSKPGSTDKALRGAEDTHTSPRGGRRRAASLRVGVTFHPFLPFILLTPTFCSSCPSRAPCLPQADSSTGLTSLHVFRRPFQEQTWVTDARSCLGQSRRLPGQRLGRRAPDSLLDLRVLSCNITTVCAGVIWPVGEPGHDNADALAAAAAVSNKLSRVLTQESQRRGEWQARLPCKEGKSGRAQCLPFL